MTKLTKSSKSSGIDAERLRNAVGIYFEALDAKPSVDQMSDPEMQEWLREIAIHQRAVRAILDAARKGESDAEVRAKTGSRGNARALGDEDCGQ